MKVKLSKSQWEEMGKKAGWMSKAYDDVADGTNYFDEIRRDILSKCLDIVEENAYYANFSIADKTKLINELNDVLSRNLVQKKN